MFVIRLQPVFIVRVLILISLLYSYMIYNVLGTYWFRYVLLMVILRGVLVVFTYIVTIIPNESFEIYNLVVVFFLIVLFLVELLGSYELDYSLITANLWVSYLGIMTLFLVGFLLIIMLLVVSLRYVSSGAFRIM